MDIKVFKRLRAIDRAANHDPVAAQRVVDLVSLIEMKLQVRFHRDLADVIDLIRHNDLDESFAKRLDPRVRPFFYHCIDERRHEDAHPDCECGIPESPS
jgi:hypothetical protein